MTVRLTIVVAELSTNMAAIDGHAIALADSFGCVGLVLYRVRHYYHATFSGRRLTEYVTNAMGMSLWLRRTLTQHSPKRPNFFSTEA